MANEPLAEQSSGNTSCNWRKVAWLVAAVGFVAIMGIGIANVLQGHNLGFFPLSQIIPLGAAYPLAILGIIGMCTCMEMALRVNKLPSVAEYKQFVGTLNTAQQEAVR